ncbi:hypothetical protein DL768_002053 [Monosporascus sp. mg162]|nr:hypothetical protein DL768_002053 [Monosporascus sp. mg162]
MANFLSLPRELRDIMYEQLLVLDEPIVSPTRPNRPRLQTTLHTDILLANKMIHSEASSVLYGQNRFDLTKCTSEQISLFVTRMGRDNSSHVRYIHINFPGIRDRDQDDVVFDDDSAMILAVIQLNCTNLHSITTYPDGDQLNTIDKPLVIEKALALINTHFKAILSLGVVVIQVYKDGLGGSVRDTMKSYGWKVEEIEREKELVQASSMWDDYDYDFSWSHDKLNDPTIVPRPYQGPRGSSRPNYSIHTTDGRVAVRTQYTPMPTEDEIEQD